MYREVKGLVVLAVPAIDGRSKQGWDCFETFETYMPLRGILNVLLDPQSSGPTYTVR